MFLACLEVLKGVGKKTFLLGQSKSELVSTTTAAELEPRVSHKANESFTCCRWLSKTSSDHKIDETFKLCQISGFMTEASIFRLSQLNVVAVVAAVVVVGVGDWWKNVIRSGSHSIEYFIRWLVVAVVAVIDVVVVVDWQTKCNLPLDANNNILSELIILPRSSPPSNRTVERSV